MSAVSNLSPLAFEVLKYLCNTGTTSYQQMDKNTLGIGTQEDFLNALDELQRENLVTLSRDATYIQHTSPEDAATEAIMRTENAENSAPISVKLADDSDVCKDIDYYLEAGGKQ
jgi:hypothetical protein